MQHQFVPTTYYRTIGTHPVALTVSDGDTIAISCVDAHGYDGSDQPVTPSGNPMSGPIAVEGLTAGDVLAVTIMHLEPLRLHGWSYPTLAGNVVDPEYVSAVPYAPGSALPKEYWDLDLTAGVVRSRGAHGKPVTAPYRPMVGCFGVAPARGEAVSTATSGRHGGNMDVRFFGAGCTVYFPVAVDGGLFFAGDAHFVQGCGEIGGTGVESAMCVDVTLSKAPMQSILWPRAEDEGYLYAVGNARPLDQALQHATSEMHRLLIECGADATTAAVLMSQLIEYHIGNVFDPAFTVVAKIAKSHLQQHGLRSTFRA
ncbi:MAG: hypothetical protein RLY87_2584 [Chloroflexota bacterium]|jgi:acetamidase/formamidase